MEGVPNIEGLTLTQSASGRNLNVLPRTGPSLDIAIDADGVVLSVHKKDGAFQDWSDDFTTLGLVDIQVNGFAGIDFNAPGITAQKMDIALAHMAATGVTKVLPTLITASAPQLLDLLGALDRAVSESVLGPLMVPGYHIEGPFLSPKEGSSGAHPAADMIAGSKELVQQLMGSTTRPIRSMTVAPEQKGVLELIPFLVEQGVACAIGHTAASREQIAAAIEAGATLSTHLGNGLPHTLNKHENPLFTQLGRDELSASFIADGIHIHPETLQTYFRAKTLARAIIVTDAVSAAGAHLSAGMYQLAETFVERQEDGTVRIPGSSYLAGSSVTMDQMVRNLMEWFGFTMPDILRLARENPSRILEGLDLDLKPGTPADFVRWQYRNGVLEVAQTLIGPYCISRQPQART